MRWPVRVFALAVAATAVVLGSAVPASAHAILVRSDPADGSVLAAAPSALRLSFSESIELRATSVDLVDGGGRRLPVTTLRLVRAGRGSSQTGADTEQPVELEVGLPVLAPDTYRVSWRTLSSDDLHTTSGVLVFGVQHAATAASLSAEPPPRPAEAVLRWVGFLGLGVLLGGLLLAVIARTRVREPSAVDALRRRLAGLAAGGGAVAAVFGPALLLLQASGTGRGTLAAAWHVLSGTAYGGRWTAREASLIALVAVALRLRAGRAGRPDALAGGVAIAALGVASALLGHSTATGGGPVRVAVDGLHLLASMSWAGGVLVAATALVPSLRRPGPGPAALAVLRAYGPVAAVSLVVIVLTGLVLAGSAVASLDALLLTVYGRTLLVKLLLVGLAAILGLRTALALRAGGGPTRRLRLEAGALAAVLAAAAVLTAAAPALGPRFAAGPGPDGNLASAQTDDLVETLSVKPNRPGRNVVAVDVFDRRRPAPGPVVGVSVTLRAPAGAQTITRSARRAADGAWTATLDDLTTAGRWQVTVTAVRAGLPATVTSYDWTVADPAARTPLVSAAPLAPLLDRLAVLGLLAVLLGATALARRRRRRREFGRVPEPAAAPRTASGDHLADVTSHETDRDVLVVGGRTPRP